MQRVNTTLANNFGNLHHRTFVFCERYFDGKIPDEPWDEAMAAEVESAALEIAAAYERSEYRAVVERIHALGNLGNKFYQDSRPWELVKHDKAKAAHVMVTCANIIKAMAVFLRPITPVLCAALENQLGMVFSWDDHRFSLVNHPLTAVEKLVNPLAGEHLAPLFGTADKFETEKANTGTKSVEGLIDINEFRKTRLCVGKIVSAEKVEKSKKLLKLSVNLGPEDNRQILAGIAEHYPPETLIGKSVVVVANLKPATLMGQKSEGMLLAAGSGKTLSLLTPDQAVEPGSPVS